MNWRAVGALLRAEWLTFSTYRTQTVLSLLALGFTVVPVYFVANALQGTMAPRIAQEGTQYFAFVLTGTMIISLVSSCISILPGVVQAGIGSGFLEGLLLTRTPWLTWLIGLSAYQILWALLRALLVMIAGWALGARIAGAAIIPGLFVLLLIMVLHWGVGLCGAAMVIAFRTEGPLRQIFVVGTTLLGGAFYPTSVIPGGLQVLSNFVPASYGLRALRRILLDGKSFAEAGSDLGILVIMTVTVCGLGLVLFGSALRRARVTGTLARA